MKTCVLKLFLNTIFTIKVIHALVRKGKYSIKKKGKNLNRKGKYILRIEGHLNKPISRIKTNKKL